MLLKAELTEQILSAAIEVHREMGPGLLESVYEECLCQEFVLRGIEFERQKEVSILYKNRKISSGLRLDIVVGDVVILELKSVESLHLIHEAQILTYLKLTGIRIGFLINFNVDLLKKGIRRFVL